VSPRHNAPRTNAVRTALHTTTRPQPLWLMPALAECWLSSTQRSRNFFTSSHILCYHKQFRSYKTSHHPSPPTRRYCAQLLNNASSQTSVCPLHIRPRRHLFSAPRSSYTLMALTSGSAATPGLRPTHPALCTTSPASNPEDHMCTSVHNQTLPHKSISFCNVIHFSSNEWHK
jgi:hypothetical protein